ncbi:MAG: peroxide stress protein YaaA [Pseudomonadales bacterium]|nr:peroxide stress protein YaaA [Pseudomonadales bacterium]
MLSVISPAKTLDFEAPPATQASSKPAMIKDAAQLVDILRDYSPDQLVGLMGISHKLGELNQRRYSNWSIPFNKNNARQAILAFRGDVYSGLHADSFSEEDFEFAQQHLRILSGLYGVLRPLDLMQAYRLEMGTKLANARGDNLYQFWGDKISKALNKQLKSLQSEYLVNLASNEYFKSVAIEKLDAEVITPVFKDFKNGKYKILSFFAKKARGSMGAYIIKNRITDPAGLKKFKADGYRYDAASSTPSQPVFLRKQN